jgi:hypothetical protein
MDLKDFLSRFKKGYHFLCNDVDMQELPPESYSSMASYYKPEQLFTNFLKAINSLYRLIPFLTY